MELTAVVLVFLMVSLMAAFAYSVSRANVPEGVRSEVEPHGRLPRGRG